MGALDLDAQLSESGSPFKSISMPDGSSARLSGVSQALFQQSRDVAFKSLFHPFVLALAQGTLPKNAFQAYIAQDAFFLRCFAEGYSIALDRPGSEVPGVAKALNQLLQGVQQELKLHESYAQEWGVDLEDHPTPFPATQAYIDFVHSIANKQAESVASILSAMVPCLRLYAHLGMVLNRAFPEAEHEYSGWLATYSSREYLQLPYTAEAVLDETGTNEPFDKLLRQYRTAMQMEADFFSAQPFDPPQRTFNLLVVDFDDTCTAQDTSSLIAQTAIQAEAAKVENPDEAVAVRTSLQLKLNWLVNNYMTKRNALLEEILPGVDEFELEEDEEEDFDMTWLGDFMDRLSDFDREMNSVVVDSNILAGIKRGSLAVTGSTVGMKPGCVELLQHAVRAGIPTCVVSVNWSSELVRAALAQHGLPAVCAEGQGGTAAGVEGEPITPGSIFVYANELEYFGEESTGKIKRRCECASDKGRIFDELLLGMAAEGGGDGDGENTGFDWGGISVYIGDSMTDLPALLSAEMGIVLGDNVWVKKVATVAGIKLRPLVMYPMEGSSFESTLSPESPVLYTASSWKEIESFMFNAQCANKLSTAQSFRDQQSMDSSSGTASIKYRSDFVSMSGTGGTGTATLTSRASHAGGKRLIPKVLAIGGSDSGGGAGIQADIKSCMSCGAYATTALTALTAQNTHGVSAVHVPPTDFLRQQIRAVVEDIGVTCVKTGMLPTAEVVEVVAEELSSLGGVVPLVIDPVMVASSGDALAKAGVGLALMEKLFPMATIVTPNIPEASELLGGRLIADVNGMKAAAEDILLRTGCRYVLLKGGHLHPSLAPHETREAAAASGKSTVDAIGFGANGAAAAAPRASERPMIVDVLFDGKNMLELSRPYISTSNSHGTGCTLASAIAAELAQGHDVPAAVQRAQRYVWRLLERSAGLPLGEGVQKPMNHGYRYVDWKARLESMSSVSVSGGRGASVAQAAAEAVAAVNAELGGRNLDTTNEKQQYQKQQSLTGITQRSFTASSRIPNDIDLRVYAVTDSDILAQRTSLESLPLAVRMAIDGGTTVVQLREKRCDGGKFAEIAAAVLEVCCRANVPLLINDRVDVAMAVGADGVHVGQDDLPAVAVRRLLGPDAIIGVSVKTVEEAIRAEADGADYLGAGAIFPTGTKDSSVLEPGVLTAICKAVRIPVVGIGGVTAGNAAETIKAGCAGVAAVSAFFGVEDPSGAAREIRAVVDRALETKRKAHTAE